MQTYMIRITKALYIKFRQIYNRLFPYKVVSLHEPPIIYIHFKRHRFKHISLDNDTPNLLKEAFSNFEKRIEEEYVGLMPNRGYKDPNTGYLITDKDEVIKSSIPYSDWDYPWAFHPLPNKLDSHFKRYDVLNFDTIISCDFIYRFGDNYFHFFNSFIGQLALLAKHDIDMSLPILIPQNIFESKYLDELKGISPKIRCMNFINSTKRKVKFEKAYFAKSNPYTTRTFSLIANFLNIEISDPKSIYETNIFLNRNTDKIRTILNIEEIRAIIQKNGFVEVCTDNISQAKQIELFRNVKNIISIHGAGLTNLLFRHPFPVNLFEIFSGNQIVAGYAMLINENKGIYKPFVGTNEDFNNKFYIEPKMFERKVTEWRRTCELNTPE